MDFVEDEFYIIWDPPEDSFIVEDGRIKRFRKKRDKFGKLWLITKEVIIKWSAIRKVTDYFMFEIKLEWHILGMKDAEVERDNRFGC